MNREENKESIVQILSPLKLLDFSDQVVLVTGGGSGIGAGISLRFAQAGASVVVNYLTSETGAMRVVEQIEGMGRDAIAVQADVSQGTEVDGLMYRTLDKFKRIDVLINNAGIFPLSTLLDMTEEQWDQVIDASLRSTFLCTKAVGVQMIDQGEGGAIVNITSIEAENPAPMHSHYNAAKGGVHMFTKSVANELGQHGIRVNAVAPGLIWKEGIEQEWPDGVQRWLKAAPLGRLGRPDDVADACLFLASPAARWITGASLLVDGGVMTKQIF
jgi:NAD(P)-dependent dehydrogenase (short-subunit alcohol dehydrogenase family)